MQGPQVQKPRYKDPSALNEACVPTLMALEEPGFLSWRQSPVLTPGLEPESAGLDVCPSVKERSRGLGSDTPGRWWPGHDKISEPWAVLWTSGNQWCGA